MLKVLFLFVGIGGICVKVIGYFFKVEVVLVNNVIYFCEILICKGL